MSEDRLEKALEMMREEPVTAEESAAARARVWERLMASTGAVCGEFRAELGKYAEGRLGAQRRLLLEDHLARCPECRRAFAEMRGERKVVAMPERRMGFVQRYRGWAIAAGVALVALYAGRERIDDMLAPSGPRATVEMVAGEMYRLPGGTMTSGAAVGEGDVVRTGPGSRAVLRLADGSAMEVNERSELWVHAAWSGQTVHLTRGDVIVQAAKQRRGHLRVQTRDSMASVKGTVFAVSSGMAGSVVTVMEGAVEVAQSGGTTMVKPGQNIASTPALRQVTPRQTVEWSKDAEKYFALLGEFATLEKQIAAIPGAPLRTQSNLMGVMPPNVVVYAAAPNLSGTIRQAVNLAEQRADESEVFKEWWNSDSAKQLRKMTDDLQSVTPLLGDEIVFVLARQGDVKIPVLLAEVKGGQADALKQAMARMIPAQEAHAFYRVTDSLLTFSDSPAHLEWALSSAGQGANAPFTTEIAQRYQRGAGWLVGLDLQPLKPVNVKEVEAGGAGNMRYVFFEQRQTAGQEENEATLKFDGARTGLASWLAPAGTTGAAEYVSSEAAIVFAASMREPRQVYDELVSQMTKLKPDFESGLKEIEAKLGFNIGNDIASALGTDFAVSIERPSIPVPGWVLAVEAYKPATLDGTLRKVVDLHNSELKPEDASKKLTFVQETVNGRAWNTVKSSLPGVGFTWTYHGGYLVAGADRAIVERAIATREGGFPLVRSAQFQHQMPSAAGVHPSGFVWLNIRGALADVVNVLPYPGLKQLANGRDPILVVLNGETERIRASSRTRLTSLVLDVMTAGAAGDTEGTGKAKAIKNGSARN